MPNKKELLMNEVTKFSSEKKEKIRETEKILERRKKIKKYLFFINNHQLHYLLDCSIQDV